jgi:hypothetical protein
MRIAFALRLGLFLASMPSFARKIADIPFDFIYCAIEKSSLCGAP